MTAKKTASLSFRAAAQRIGCTHKAIGDAVEAGRIPLLPDGKVSAEAVDAWNAGRRAKRGGARRKQIGAPDSNRRKVSTPKGGAAAAGGPPAPAPAAINLAAFAQTLAAGGMFADRASAELARDSYMARLRQLEFEERSGKLIEVDKVKAEIARACSAIRTRLLAIPSEKAPEIARLKSATLVQAALQDAIQRALEGLAVHFGGKVGE